MKMHAAAGADILSAIKFPYPVVPIVRHHHENWDGTGYPDGLRGTDIPIGARILAVIDCFDALTSDRPYRKSLSDSEAMDILMQRRGTMYDPLVVDTFAAVKDRLPDTHAKTEAAVDPTQKPTLDQNAISRSRLQAAPRRMLDEDFVRAGQTVLASLQDATFATFAILYVRDYNTDQAFGAVFPEAGPAVDANVMALGSGVTGWVIANGRAMVNADAALDFPSQPPPAGVNRYTAIPLNVAGETVGALTCYLDSPRGFGEREVAVMEKIAATFGEQPLQDLIKRVLAKVARAPITRSIH